MKHRDNDDKQLKRREIAKKEIGKKNRPELEIGSPELCQEGLSTITQLVEQLKQEGTTNGLGCQ